MKLSITLTVLSFLASPVNAFQAAVADKFHATKDYIGNTIWVFGSDGIFIYSADGEQLKAEMSVEGICGPKADYDGPSYHYCRFSDVVSDGKKFVWAAVNRGKPTIDVFDIDTGSVVGSFPTCSSPQNLEYHSLRDEVWVRCSDVAEGVGETTNLDVFSASNPTGDVQTDILLQERALEENLSSDGYSVMDNSLGDIGYLTDDSLNTLFKIDLSQKQIEKKIEEFPDAYGLDVAVYSPVNNHIYIRAYVCCTCGFEGASLETCNKDGTPGDQVPITTGPFAGTTQEGKCGSRSCGSLEGVDTIGVYEYDTVSETVVANHVLQEGFGGNPYVSPDGNWIVIMGKNGGKTVRILKAGENGLKSSLFIDLELGFDNSGLEDQSVARYVTFIVKDGKNCLVVPSGSSHMIAIVELPLNKSVTNDSIKIDYVKLSDEPFEYGAPHGMFRRVMWAEGTDYVWVSGSEELYVVDIAKKLTVKTFTGFKTRTLLSVQNYERSRQIDLQKSMVQDMQNQLKEDMTKQMQETMGSQQNESSSAGENAAITIGTLALIACIANLAYMTKMKRDFNNSLSRDEPVKFIHAKREFGDQTSENDSNLISVN